MELEVGFSKYITYNPKSPLCLKLNTKNPLVQLLILFIVPLDSFCIKIKTIIIIIIILIILIIYNIQVPT